MKWALRCSPWRGDELWETRLRDDRAVLDMQLSPGQADAIRRIVGTTGADGKLEFLVVYGSVSRGDQSAGSDLDVYYETSDAAVEAREADPESRWHVFGESPGALLDSLRRGDEFAFALIGDALVVEDGGRFRDLIVAVDEEQLRPADPPETAAAAVGAFSSR